MLIAFLCSGLHISSFDFHDSVQYRYGNNADFEYHHEGNSQYLSGNTAGLLCHHDHHWSRGCTCAPPSDEAGVPKPVRTGILANGEWQSYFDPTDC